MYASSFELKDGVGKLQKGSQELDEVANKLNENSPKILNGARDLENGIGKLNGNMPELENGVKKLYNGSTELKNGSDLLKSKNGEILSGASALKNGISSAESGAEKLKSGQNKLNGGLLEIQSGSTEMATKLKEGSEKIDDSLDVKDIPDRISNPVSAVHVDKDKVDSNGEEMAPYMLSVALFVGAIATNVIIDAYKPYKNPIKTKDWYLSKTAVMGMIYILQAVCVYLVLLTMGLSPVERTKTFFFIVLISTTFMSLVTLFNIVLGKVGAFLMLVFLIIQLSGSAGTYPVELSSSFYQKITGYLPMTYSIKALRNTISTGLPIDSYVTIFVIILLISNILIYLYFNRKVKSNDYSRIRLLPE